MYLLVLPLLFEPYAISVNGTNSGYDVVGIFCSSTSKVEAILLDFWYKLSSLMVELLVPVNSVGNFWLN